jgi:(1->4)-alpha-D-glucan 1-alpha-D-glucosylmutase
VPVPRLPTATYRLQLQPGFGFAAAAAAVPYLADLGVSHLYLSPVLQAAPGSAHGYDVVDHSRLSADLGGEADWARLVAAARGAGLGIVVDLVPNHMALPAPEWHNPALWEVLHRGREARHASWFDVDWEHGEGRLVLPLLGAPEEEPALDLTGGPAGEPVLRYHEHAFPLAAGSERLAGTALLDAQHYRLAYWRDAPRVLNYRRFFDIATLIGLRVEEPDVFDATHQLLLEKVLAGEISGLRIDHPDGLADPAGYFRRLADRCAGAWLVAEKILMTGEELPTDWALDGSTGYDSLATVTGAFLDPVHELPLTDAYQRFVGEKETFTTITVRSKRRTALGPLRPETARLARAAGTPHAVEPLGELLAAWPAYRCYVPPGGPAHPEDVRSAVFAGFAAGFADPSHRSLYERWVSAVILGEGEFATRLQQTTAMVMAKGMEDTAFYRYHRWSALCEVGGDPAVFGAPLAAFHEACSRLADEWPATMTTLSTHDTKRSEDVRFRLLAAAEQPHEWQAAVRRWHDLAAAHRCPAGPDPKIEYLFWQTLVGGWPLSPERARSYLVKASREAKEHTSWTDPDEAYEAALAAFCDGLLADPAVRADVAGFVDRLAPAVAAVTLGAKLVQITMPGIPDVYQGCEGVARMLVDPDNRGPLDLDRARQRLAAAVDPSDPAPVPDPLVDLDAAKRAVTAHALRLRRSWPDAFGLTAGYAPLTADGPAGGHLLAFQRGGPITLATRGPAGLAASGGWANTTLALPEGEWVDVLTERHLEGRVAVAALLDRLPCALLRPVLSPLAG